MRIDIVNVDGPQTKTNASGGKYEVLDIAYRDSQGQIKAKKIMSFTVPKVFEALKDAVKGSAFEVQTEKNGKFVNWTDITSAASSDVWMPPTTVMNGNDGKAPGDSYKTPVGRVTGSNYPSSEEREWAGIKIGRQACLNTAVALLAVGHKGVLDPKEVIALAASLEEWVNRKFTPQEALDNMKDDIPE